MKYYLKDILTRLQKYSATLDQESFLVDKPWVVSNSDETFEKLIFKRDGSVILSINGDVTIGKWEYFPEAQSLLIDYGDKKKLYRHQYLDKAVLALKIDGPDRGDESYYLLANENAVPNLNVEHYLKKKYLQGEHKELLLLDNGNEIEIENYSGADQIELYSNVRIEGSPIENGEYSFDNGLKKIVVKNGEVFDIKKKVGFKNDIYVWISDQIPVVGDKVEGLEYGSFNIDSGGKYTIVVNNGAVVDVKGDVIEKLSIFLAIAIAFIAMLMIIYMLIL